MARPTKTTAKALPKGRPSDYTEEMADIILERIADGESLRSICREDGMPNKTKVFRWLVANESFRDLYRIARETQADSHFDDIVDISDEECTMVKSSKHGTRDDDGEGNTEVVFDATAVARNRLRVDARKWVASKLRPRVYGDKIEEEAPVQLPIGTIKVEVIRAKPRDN